MSIILHIKQIKDLCSFKVTFSAYFSFLDGETNSEKEEDFLEMVMGTGRLFEQKSSCHRFD